MSKNKIVNKAPTYREGAKAYGKSWPVIVNQVLPKPKNKSKFFKKFSTNVKSSVELMKNAVYTASEKTYLGMGAFRTIVSKTSEQVWTELWGKDPQTRKDAVIQNRNLKIGVTALGVTAIALFMYAASIAPGYYYSQAEIKSVREVADQRQKDLNKAYDLITETQKNDKITQLENINLRRTIGEAKAVVKKPIVVIAPVPVSKSVTKPVVKSEQKSIVGPYSNPIGPQLKPVQKQEQKPVIKSKQVAVAPSTSTAVNTVASSTGSAKVEAVKDAKPSGGSIWKKLRSFK